MKSNMKPKEYLDSILDDNEKLAVQMFYDNVIQREAIKKILLVGAYNNGTLKKGEFSDPTRNFTLGLVSNSIELKLNDEKLGSQLRTAWEAIQLIELAFSNMANYKKEEERSSKKDNPAK